MGRILWTWGAVLLWNQEHTMSNATSIAITGYEKECNCEHCGRPLVHGIRISDGRVVGASCFNNTLTCPRIYNGKPYRIGEANVIRYAKAAERGHLRVLGISSHMLTFEAA